uniref:Uncharacterized protein n=1 Tax=Tetranychus urticae TaxID=32264 RepID=T1KYG6_TETUR
MIITMIVGEAQYKALFRYKGIRKSDAEDDDKGVFNLVKRLVTLLSNQKTIFLC